MLGRNLLAGLIGSISSALLGFAVVPLYLRYLGVEAYGLIGFFATTQAMFQLLDMGLAPSLNREVAKCSSPADWQSARQLLHTLACAYWGLAAVIALVVYSIAPWIATRWLHASELTPAELEHTVVLLGLVIACRWPVGLYQGALMGAQRITVSSAIGTAMTTTSTLGAIAVLAWVSPTIEAFFVWQAIVGILYALLMRHAAWRALGRDAHMAFNLGALRTIWRFSAGMALIGLLGLVFTQLDKVLLSRILPLADYGRYMIAVVVTGGLYVFVTPFFNAVYPRFSMLVAQGDTAGLETRYRLSTGLLTAILFPVAGFLSVFAVDVLTMWTRDADLARAAGPLVSLLAVGSALHGVMHLPHALQLAHGKTELPLIINGTLLVTFAPLIVVLAVARGATGGALAWLVLHSIYVVLSTWLTHRQLLTRLRWKWISRDVGTPFMVSAVVSVAAGWLATAFVFPGPRLAIGLLGIVVATSSCVALSTLVRHAALVRLKALAAHGFLSRTRAGVHP